jgi:hypothetical protein
MWYNLFGSINAILIFVSLYGVFLQLNKVWQRRNNNKPKITEILSQNQFTMSFLAYFCFFIYGYSIQPFNHYIVWPRLISSILVLLILFEMWHDRRSKISLFCLIIAVMVLFCGAVGLLFHEVLSAHSKTASAIFIVSITILLAQGYTHQISLIIRSGKTGAIDIRMSQFIFMMDISTIAFATSMGVSNGWPLILLAVVSGVTKLIIMYLFRWVRLSPTAKTRSFLS